MTFAELEGGEVLVDGRARWRALERLEIAPVEGIHYQYSQLTPEMIPALILGRNVSRRHLRAGVRALSGVLLSGESLPELTVDELNDADGRYPSPGSPQTAREIATAWGVGVRTVYRARRLCKASRPDLVTAVLSGKRSLAEALEEVAGNERGAVVHTNVEWSRNHHRHLKRLSVELQSSQREMLGALLVVMASQPQVLELVRVELASGALMRSAKWQAPPREAGSGTLPNGRPSGEGEGEGGAEGQPAPLSSKIVPRQCEAARACEKALYKKALIQKSLLVPTTTSEPAHTHARIVESGHLSPDTRPNETNHNETDKESREKGIEHRTEGNDEKALSGEENTPEEETSEDVKTPLRDVVQAFNAAATAWRKRWPQIPQEKALRSIDKMTPNTRTAVLSLLTWATFAQISENFARLVLISPAGIQRWGLYTMHRLAVSPTMSPNPKPHLLRLSDYLEIEEREAASGEVSPVWARIESSSQTRAARGGGLVSLGVGSPADLIRGAVSSPQQIARAADALGYRRAVGSSSPARPRVLQPAAPAPTPEPRPKERPLSDQQQSLRFDALLGMIGSIGSGGARKAARTPTPAPTFEQVPRAPELELESANVWRSRWQQTERGAFVSGSVRIEPLSQIGQAPRWRIVIDQQELADDNGRGVVLTGAAPYELAQYLPEVRQKVRR